MLFPHDMRFRYRPYILTVVLVSAVGAALVDPASTRAEKWTDALAIGLVALLGYGITKVLTWLAVRWLTGPMPRLVRAWGLLCFYGALPLLLLGLSIGSVTLHAPTPSHATVAFVIAAGVSIAAGAFAAIRATTGRRADAWAGC